MIKLNIPSELNTKPQIITYYAEALNFAPYWKANWDSFIDCTREALFKDNVEVVHILEKKSEDIVIYLDILRDLSIETRKLEFQYNESQKI